ncbi:hydantoinase B/oxoprolinase family protein [Mesorhizobium sp. M0317]|uniref:hydantoinase B/oxoprolinase family protein n=1 Tax=Mesorhizobium sp. M0317 TaxID=2956935 RepID=UPI00333599ED
MSYDPVLLALLQKQLDHISRHMGWVMTRTARSPIFSESHDFSCFISTAKGDALSVADGIPIHTGGGCFAVRAVLKAFGNDLGEGDVFLLSDPYEAGGNHLPDWTVLRPVVIDGQLCAFCTNRAHQSDIGGGAAGTYNAAATEIFHEGIRLPVLRLVQRGNIRDDLWKLLLLNSRCPDLLDGDLRAMLGSTKTGADRVSAIIDEVGVATATELFEGILDHGERVMRSVIAELPNGEYYGEDASDNDCFDTVEVAVRVRAIVRGDRMIVDFTGTDQQIKGFKNSSIANTHAAVFMALLSFFEQEIPRNEGAFKAIDIIAPDGTVVNARPPAPMTMNTVHPTSEIVHACWKALSQAKPKSACAGWGKTAHCISSGQRSDGGTFVIYHWHGSAAGGALRGRDGFNSVGQLCTLGGLSLPNVEMYEQLYPMRILKQEFRTDAAGIGAFRGGTGIHYVAEMDSPAEYSFRGEGARSPTGYGVAGGGGGAKGDIRITLSDGQVVVPPQYGIRRLGPLRLEIQSPGGGGYGDPAERDPHLVVRDVRDGVLSLRSARHDYLVALDEAFVLDEAETATMRAGRDTRVFESPVAR